MDFEPEQLPEDGVTAGRWLLVGVLTGVEVATLSVWLALVAGAPPFSRPIAVSVVVLCAGLQVEHFLTDLAVNGADIGFPLGQTLVISVSEAVLWLGWLTVAASMGGLRGIFVAGVAFAVALSIQHTVETNALRHRPLDARLFEPATVGFSLITAAGATAWLALTAPVAGTESFAGFIGSLGLDAGAVGFLFLTAGVVAERVMVVKLARQNRTSTRVPYRRRHTSNIRIR